MTRRSCAHRPAASIATVALMVAFILMLAPNEARPQPTGQAGTPFATPNAAGQVRPGSVNAVETTSRPPWSRDLLIITDSVVLGAVPIIQKGLPDWRIDVEGRSAFMLPGAIDGIRKRARVPAIVIIAVGHNTVWDKGRKNFDFWSKKFDREADTLITELKSRGAERIVWVQLRELTLALIPGERRDELARSWYFPYVNERLRALRERRPEIILADWTTVGRQNGITYDSIHLNMQGARLMLELLKSTAGIQSPAP